MTTKMAVLGDSLSRMVIGNQLEEGSGQTLISTISENLRGEIPTFLFPPARKNPSTLIGTEAPQSTVKNG